MSGFPTRLRHARQRCDMSLSDVARASGVTRSYLHLLEMGQSNPTAEKLLVIARALDTSVGELLGETLEETMLTPDEMRMLEAYRAGDLREMLRLALERTDGVP